jgi:hypothetical protein
MKRLLTISAIVALGALTACNPLQPVPTIDAPVTVDISEGDVDVNPVIGGEGGVEPVTPDGEGGDCYGGVCPTEDTVPGVPSEVCDTPGEGGCPAN